MAFVLRHVCLSQRPVLPFALFTWGSHIGFILTGRDTDSSKQKKNSKQEWCFSLKMSRKQNKKTVAKQVHTRLMYFRLNEKWIFASLQRNKFDCLNVELSVFPAVESHSHNIQNKHRVFFSVWNIFNFWGHIFLSDWTQLNLCSV